MAVNHSGNFEYFSGQEAHYCYFPTNVTVKMFSIPSDCVPLNLYHLSLREVPFILSWVRFLWLFFMMKVLKISQHPGGPTTDMLQFCKIPLQVVGSDEDVSLQLVSWALFLPLSWNTYYILRVICILFVFIEAKYTQHKINHFKV